MTNVKLDRKVRKFMKAHPGKSYKEALIAVYDIREEKKRNRKVEQREKIQKEIVKLENKIKRLKQRLRKEEIGFSLCFRPNGFIVNGIEADLVDFGTYAYNEDHNEVRFCCGRRSRKILRKYGITRREYRVICERLEKELPFEVRGSFV